MDSFSAGLFVAILVTFFSTVAFSQAPTRISHQTILRDLDNELITNQNVSVQITLLQGGPSGANLFRETHNLSTDVNGLLAIEIGDGAVQNGSFSSINWSAGPFFVQQSIDPAGGTNYTINRTTQLLSVPFALHAQSAGRAKSAAWADEANAILNLDQFEAPIGSITIFPAAATSIPSGWLLCDGASYDAAFYPQLFAVIGTTYGSEPNNRFLVPDLRGQGPMGLDASQTEFDMLGKTGGEKTHILTIPEMPAHNHGGTTGAGGIHSHQFGTTGFVTSAAGALSRSPGADGSFDNDNLQTTQSAGSHTHPIQSEGGDSAHNNLQPYTVINFIIKAN